MTEDELTSLMAQSEKEEEQDFNQDHRLINLAFILIVVMLIAAAYWTVG